MWLSKSRVMKFSHTFLGNFFLKISLLSVIKRKQAFVAAIYIRFEMYRL